MKYTNFEQIKDIVLQIKEQEKKLEILQHYPEVTVASRSCSSSIDICTHMDKDMTCYAIDFIDILITDTEERIANFKNILSKL